LFHEPFLTNCKDHGFLKKSWINFFIIDEKKDDDDDDEWISFFIDKNDDFGLPFE